MGISKRRLEETFSAATGLTPKEYQRLARFRATVDRIECASAIGWAQFAVEHGYYDQSHLSNDFRAHVGMCPSGYLAARGAYANHVPLQATA